MKRRLAFALPLVALVPLFVTTGIVANLATESTENIVEAQAVGTIAQVSDSVAAQLSALERSAIKLSYSRPIQQLITGEFGPDETATLLDEAREECEDEFYLTNDIVAVQVSAEGDSWFSVLDAPPGIIDQAPILFPNAAEQIKKQGGRSIYKSFRVEEEEFGSSAPSFISQWRRVYSDETKEAIGYIVVTVRERYLASVVASVSEIPGSRALIVADHSYTVISNVGPGLLRTGDVLASSVRLDAKTAPGEQTVIEERNYRVATSPVTNTDLVAVLLIPSSYFFASRDSVVVAFFAVAAVSGVVALICAAVMSRSITQPIDRLMGKLEAAGSKETIEAMPTDTNLREPSISSSARDELAKLDREFDVLMSVSERAQRERENHLKEHHRLELKVLQAQMNPHFLGNALESIRQLANLGNTSGVAELSGALAGTVNRTFRNRGDWTTLAAEFESAKDYGVIASYHHMGRIVQTEVLPESLADMRVPYFILQPLVENAYEHGFGKEQTAGHIEIIARRESNRVRIDVSDNGAGIDSDALTKLTRGSVEEVLDPTHFGLQSVEHRLRLLYGNEASIMVRSDPWIVTTVSIFLPAPDKTVEFE